MRRERMRRQIALGIVVGLAGVLVVWWLVARTRAGSDARSADASASTAKPAPTTPRETLPAVTPSRWTLDPDPAGPLRLEGQVIDVDGSAVGGAVVRVGSVPPRSTVTEVDGSFAFDGLLDRTYNLSASTPTKVGAVRYRLTGSADPAIIRVGEGVSVSVTVEGGGHPIAGAKVRANEGSGTTDATGRVTIGPVRPGWVMVVAEADGFAAGTTVTPLQSAGDRGEVTLEVRQGFSISGVVVDETGSPVAGADVQMIAEEDWGVDGGPPRESNPTDGQGRFTLRALLPGPHQLRAVDGFHAPALSKIVVVDRAVTGVRIAMASGGQIAGRVVDRDRRPVAFATVKVASIGRNGDLTEPRQATSDRDGVFALRGLSRSRFRVRAESSEAVSNLVDVDLVTAPRTPELELVLAVAGVISGVVVDGSGRGVAEVTVHARPDLMGGASPELAAFAETSSTTTSGGGEFAFRTLPDGAYWLWLGPSSADTDASLRTGAAAKTGASDVRLVLTAPGLVKGTIVAEGASSALLAVVQVGSRPAVQTTRGTFSVDELAPGTYDVVIRGGDFPELTLRDIRVESGKVTDVGTIKVPRGRTLRGRVVDHTGAPVAAASVRVGASLWDTSEARTTTSDQTGEFILTGLAAGELAVMAEHETAGRSLGSVLAVGPADPAPITLRLRRFGSLSGIVTSRGTPVAHISVSETSPGTNMQVTFTETDDEGRFTMPRVTEGPHILHAIDRQPMLSMVTSSTTVTVVAGAKADVTIDLPAAGIRLTVEIRPLPDNRVDGAEVFLVAGTVTFQNGKQLSDAFLQGRGRARKLWNPEISGLTVFEDIVAGDYSVCVIPLTGSLRDPTLMQRIERDSEALAVYCKAVRIAAAPDTQRVITEVPAMRAPSPR